MKLRSEVGDIPADYQRLEGSERHASSEAALLGEADPNETFTVTIVLRRRPDGPPMPDLADFAAASPGQHQPLSPDEFAALYHQPLAILQREPPAPFRH